MIFHFKTSDVTFFDEDQQYFESKFFNLKKVLNDNEKGDAVDVRITLEKNKHHTGERFEAQAHITCPHNGKFDAKIEAENIKKCADELYEKLKPQIVKFKEKNK
jgi:ribosomal subunit interface protein